MKQFIKSYNRSDDILFGNNEEDNNEISLMRMTHEMSILERIKNIPFPFIQRIEGIDINRREITFTSIDLDNICLLNYNSDLKFICYTVLKFVLISFHLFNLNHNDLSVRNIMFNAKDKYNFETYDGFQLSEYVPVIIDFELSQIFKDEKLLLSSKLLMLQCNITHELNSFYCDIFKFLKGLCLVIDQGFVKLDNLDYPRFLYNKIFIEDKIRYSKDYLFTLETSCLNECIKNELTLNNLREFVEL